MYAVNDVAAGSYRWEVQTLAHLLKIAMSQRRWGTGDNVDAVTPLTARAGPPLTSTS